MWISKRIIMRIGILKLVLIYIRRSSEEEGC